MIPNGANVIESLHQVCVKVLLPAFEGSNEFDDCEEQHKRMFMYGVGNFIRFLSSKNYRNIKLYLTLEKF